MHLEHSQGPAVSWRLVLFGIVQVAVVAVGAVLTQQGLAKQEARRQLPQMRTEPLEIRPLHNVPAMVSDEQLTAVLTKLQPVLGDKPQMNHADHALRMWTAKSKFPHPQALSGNDLRELLLDHRRFTKAWGEKTPAFLMTGRSGVVPRLRDGKATASHTDHTLACLAESLTPLDFPVITARGETQVQAMMKQSLFEFSLNQTEYEWSALAYALYIDQAEWFTREGQKITFDRLADRILRQELPQGVCLGNHRLHALVMLLRVDEQKAILQPETRTRIVAFLKDMVQRLIKSQNAEGWWDSAWAGKPLSESAAGDAPSSPLSIRILATGHALEWMALAPAELHAPEDVRVRAAQWLVKTVEPMSDREIRANYTFLTHAGRALALWRAQFPYEVPLLPPREDEETPVEDGRVDPPGTQAGVHPQP